MQTARMLRCSRFDCTGKRAHASVGCRMKSCGCVCSAPEVSCNALKLSCACTHQPRICAGRWPRRFLRSDGKRTGGLPCHGLESASVGRREGLDPSKVPFRCPRRRSRLKHASLDRPRPPCTFTEKKLRRIRCTESGKRKAESGKRYGRKGPTQRAGI